MIRAYVYLAAFCGLIASLVIGVIWPETRDAAGLTFVVAIAVVGPFAIWEEALNRNSLD